MYTVQDVRKVLDYLQSRDVRQFSTNTSLKGLEFLPVGEFNFTVTLNVYFNCDTQNHESQIVVTENRVL